ncbi:MAG: putative lipoprotein [Phycisphaerales bacterium]|nr:putative lipoprotein [Phycisphaerales bacterium]
MSTQSAPGARRGIRALVGIVLCSALTGCASYATPGRPADFKALGVSRESLTDSSINTTLAKEPLAKFPTGIAAVRIQAPGYKSNTAEGWGGGSYCVITTRDIETDKDWDRLSKLPMVTGVAPINRLLLPQQLNTDLELRQAAASLHADMVLIYTIDTQFYIKDHLAPLTVVTLGLSPNQTAQVVTTASAVLMDTRNGYLYGYAEATEKGMQLSNSWTTEAAVDDARHRTESRAFGKLIVQLADTWPQVVKNFKRTEVGAGN